MEKLSTKHFSRLLLIKCQQFSPVPFTNHPSSFDIKTHTQSSMAKQGTKLDKLTSWLFLSNCTKITRENKYWGNLNNATRYIVFQSFYTKLCFYKVYIRTIKLGCFYLFFKYSSLILIDLFNTNIIALLSHHFVVILSTLCTCILIFHHQILSNIYLIVLCRNLYVICVLSLNPYAPLLLYNILLLWNKDGNLWIERIRKVG